jgi:HSP20 family molecular chaperone IbpA
VKVTVEGGVLEITGERKEEKEEGDKKHHRINALTVVSAEASLCRKIRPGKKSLLTSRMEY